MDPKLFWKPYRMFLKNIEILRENMHEALEQNLKLEQLVSDGVK